MELIPAHAQRAAHTKPPHDRSGKNFLVVYNPIRKARFVEGYNKGFLSNISFGHDFDLTDFLPLITSETKHITFAAWWGRPQFHFKDEDLKILADLLPPALESLIILLEPNIQINDSTAIYFAQKLPPSLKRLRISEKIKVEGGLPVHNETMISLAALRDFLSYLPSSLEDLGLRVCNDKNHCRWAPLNIAGFVACS